MLLLVLLVMLLLLLLLLLPVADPVPRSYLAGELAAAMVKGMSGSGRATPAALSADTTVAPLLKVVTSGSLLALLIP